MFNAHERNLLRELARRVAEIAALPIQTERRQRWTRHNMLRSRDPMLLVFPEGAWRELLPENSLKCESETGRNIEAELRRRIYYHEHFADDTVVLGEWAVQKAVTGTGWGLEPQRIQSTQEHGAWHHNPVLLEYSDLKRLRVPQLSHDEKESQRRLANFQDLFGDILSVQLCGVTGIGFHLMRQYTDLRGLEQMLFDLHEEPKLVHEFLEFVTCAHLDILEQWKRLNLLGLNNDNRYQSSGGNGWTTELPKPGFDPEHVRPCDMWACAESQEFAVVSPGMHVEFAMDYEKRLLEPFGLTGYGCCEDLTLKLKDVTKLPGMRRISVCPWADVVRCAEQLQDRFIFSWKPNPAMLVGAFSEEAIRAYVRKTLDAAKGCVLEIILKDTHTIENQPERMIRWLQIAREEIQTHAGRGVA